MQSLMGNLGSRKVSRKHPRLIIQPGRWELEAGQGGKSPLLTLCYLEEAGILRDILNFRKTL